MLSNSYYFRKIHSLLGVIPVGAFLLEHMITNYAMKQDPTGKLFSEKVQFLHDLPFIDVLEIFMIWIPILLHGIYGLYVAYTAKYNASSYGYFRNMMFNLQRISGVILLIFISWHFFETRWAVGAGADGHKLIDVMKEIVKDPIQVSLYVVGVLAAAFHFANGMWSFLVSWGITVGARAQRISTYVWMGLFVIMSYMFIQSLIGFMQAN